MPSEAAVRPSPRASQKFSSIVDVLDVSVSVAIVPDASAAKIPRGPKTPRAPKTPRVPNTPPGSRKRPGFRSASPGAIFRLLLTSQWVSLRKGHSKGQYGPVAPAPPDVYGCPLELDGT